jgi:hypothetical protein
MGDRAEGLAVLLSAPRWWGDTTTPAEIPPASCCPQLASPLSVGSRTSARPRRPGQ